MIDMSKYYSYYNPEEGKYYMKKEYEEAEDYFKGKKKRKETKCGGSGWSALEGSSHPAFNAVRENQVAKQKEETVQYSEETIFVCDSADIEVNTTSIKAALSVQAALQAAIVLVLTIAIGRSAEAESIAQELFQKSSIKQINRQRTVIKNSRNVKIDVSDTEIAINIQVLIELLLALLVELEIEL